ncbi:MAG: hypothetical protein HC824_19365 [Synechococcales cyanobacterium RM1_1_8]|nr:hypothetical protein [Synechococcales cyanobacterium RM1_1_8]
MALKVISNFDTAFSLSPEAQAHLFEQLAAPAFCQQVAQQKGWAQVRFTELLFQPVPYSSQTPKGMAAEFEPYHSDIEQYAIVHVPPPLMFQAKVFKPSRLCAVFEKVA